MQDGWASVWFAAKHSCFATDGEASDWTVPTTFATLGLSALLAQSAFAFSVVKYAGAAFLIYLGVRTLLDKERGLVVRGMPFSYPLRVALGGESGSRSPSAAIVPQAQSSSGSRAPSMSRAALACIAADPDSTRAIILFER